MEITIDRFEGEFAIVELPDGTIADMPKVLLPGAKEGDIFSIQKEKKKTREREEHMKKMMDDLWQ